MSQPSLKDVLARKQASASPLLSGGGADDTKDCLETLPFAKKMPESWLTLLKDDLNTDAVRELEIKVDQEYQKDRIFPPKEKIFRALQLCPVDKVKVVILGQDPYHTFGQANGLAFSCEEKPLQPSLRHLYAEVAKDVDSPVQNEKLLEGDLSPWATQGVLLLNWTLTVKSNRAGSHKNLGWQHITEAIIKRLSATNKNLVFLLWGRHAHEATKFIVNPKTHCILKSSHPSPFSYTNSSAGIPAFCGCGHFKKCNDYLQNIVHRRAIVWN